MTTTEKKRLRKLIADLKHCGDQADRLELLLGNGAEVGSHLGAIAEELELKLEALD